MTQDDVTAATAAILASIPPGGGAEAMPRSLQPLFDEGGQAHIGRCLGEGG